MTEISPRALDALIDMASSQHETQVIGEAKSWLKLQRAMQDAQIVIVFRKEQPGYYSIGKKSFTRVHKPRRQKGADIAWDILNRSINGNEILNASMFGLSACAVRNDIRYFADWVEEDACFSHLADVIRQIVVSRDGSISFKRLNKLSIELT